MVHLLKMSLTKELFGMDGKIQSSELGDTIASAAVHVTRLGQLL